MTILSRRTTLAGLSALAASSALPARAQTVPEKSKITLAVGGKALLYYLPLTVAERRGLFKAEGLEVEINDFAGGARALQALVGGSVDVVTGAYEHTIRMQAKSQDIRGIVELGRFPGITIAVRKELADKIKSAADFKGLKIGVTAPGSSTSLTAQYAMLKAGLKTTDAAIIGIGAGASAVAAIKQGQVDVISHLEPVISKLEADGDIVVLIDTRTEAGTRAVFGGANPAAMLYCKNDFIKANPITTQRLANAFIKGLKWLETATPENVADLVPPEYHLGDRPLYIRAVKSSLESYSRTGIPTPDGMKSMMDALKILDPELASSTVDLSTTFVDTFAKKAGMGA
jgi:NitT/TauT family transport system substrate-binding protein